MIQEVVKFCKSHLVVNREAFRDPRLDLIINDARFIILSPESIYMYMYLSVYICCRNRNSMLYNINQG